MRINKNLFFSLGLSIMLILAVIVPAVSAQTIDQQPLTLAHDDKSVIIDGQRLEIDKIPEIKRGAKVEVKDSSVYKETIDGKLMLHVIKINEVNHGAFSTQDTKCVHSYTVNDYYDHTYMGTAELDTTWFISGGNITGINNHGWGTVPDYQWPDEWTNDGSDAYVIPGDPTQGVSYAYLTDHYSLLGFPVDHTTYYLETDVNGIGGYTDHKLIID
ncbi:hypothetical protein DesLBE_0061 [Desulfitobacterium sp. LBE]|uniref:Uncharacterized protein n=5 Tax=root TaxID=1 RepID=Q24VQ8_DESHY|nr:MULTISPECIES: hypothetical protein [Desulfitobacterium]ACL21283.1 hypothetical protein Dhaf_3264 [Desulfitobacterium hafniense DCB-2]EHL06666.1 hypothetical protein HMPREF0322_02715 [Desulfitobacterium hafniense DP7]KTE92673.1 hypothetical protein AT727_18375 [Desulfitobacterium hafniense]MEA5023021.1 hypothetical protein [Desulfitobacterium hafniense]TWH55885.1 hypothetical protein DesLBE_0061 [Desulfitobacterium sp. LBE]